MLAKHQCLNGIVCNFTVIEKHGNQKLDLEGGKIIGTVPGMGV